MPGNSKIGRATVVGAAAGMPRKNDEAWARVIRELGLEARIAVDGRAVVTADELKEASGGREPRLLAKIDHRGDLPKPFQRASGGKGKAGAVGAARAVGAASAVGAGGKGGDWGILPTRRGEYVIGVFDVFAPFPSVDGSPAEALRMPPGLETVAFGPSLSEAAAVNILQSSGALGEFLGEKRLLHTIAGRMGTQSFDFVVGPADFPVAVDRAQIEIDAGFEGDGSIALIEAKREGAADFVVRQLYYPWRHWRDRCTKPVRPVYLVVGGTQLRLIEYAFDDPGRYAPPRVVRERRYSLVGGGWEAEGLADVMARLPVGEEPAGVPFPQADQVDRVLEHVGYVAEGLDTADVILEEFDVDSRDIDYYMNAAIYLGFVVKARTRPTRWALTGAGRELVDEKPEAMSFKVAEAILGRRIFREVLVGASESGAVLGTREQVAERLAEVAASPVGGKTLQRRARTVLSWVRWLRETEAAARG